MLMSLRSLPKKINFVKDGKEFIAEFHYPWLPSRCNFCDKWGHVENVCVMKGKEKKLKAPSVEEVEAKGGSIQEIEITEKEVAIEVRDEIVETKKKEMRKLMEDRKLANGH